MKILFGKLKIVTIFAPQFEGHEMQEIIMNLNTEAMSFMDQTMKHRTGYESLSMTSLRYSE